MKERIYSANGFAVKSDVKLLGWKEIKTVSQELIFLSLSSGYFTLEYDKTNWPHIYKHPNGALCFNWGNKLAFLVSDNYKDIIYMKNDGEDTEDISFAINFILSFISVKYNRLPFHACAITDHNDAAIMILGKSGVGKSTLLLNLLQSGRKYISEEICFAYADDSNASVYSGNKVIRLNQNMYTHAKHNQVLHSAEKICFWNSDFESSENISVLRGIFVLEKNESLIETHITKICKSEMIKMILTKYLYTRSIVKWFPFSNIISLIAGIVEHADCYLISYPTYISATEFEALAINAASDNSDERRSYEINH